MDELRQEARAAWAIARKELQITLRYRLNAVNEVIQPIYQVLIPGILLGATFAVGGEAVGLAETAGTTDIVGFLFLGMLALTLASAGFWWVAFGVKRELDAGTLEPMWLTPTRRETWVIGQTIGGLVMSAVSTAMLVVIGIWLFGATLAPSIVVALPILAVSSVGVLGIGYLIGAIVLRMRDANFFVDAADFIFVALSGAAFPIIVLPELVRWISYLLPTTYALDLVRVAGLGTRPLLPIPVEWILMAVTSVALLVVGRWAWLRTERRMRIQGTTAQH
ncbi:MAG: ABC transporter permease [Chloroflexota bacterium]|jgi:ABC-2 type transport system permease protein|nr:ABC transporter permease [Chloroflexota bacterium]